MISRSINRQQAKRVSGALNSVSRQDNLDGHSRLFVSSAHLHFQHHKRDKPVFRDAYTIKQDEARRAAAIVRRAETNTRRAVSLGDAIKGAAETTLFVQSFDLAEDAPTVSNDDSKTRQQPERQNQDMKNLMSGIVTECGSSSVVPNVLEGKAFVVDTDHSDSHLNQKNHFLTSNDMQRSLWKSERLSAPYKSVDRSGVDLAREQAEELEHKQKHAVRSEALARILAPENASSQQRGRINTQRCIHRFGRHNTDQDFRSHKMQNHERAGPDTGSSEVQIAILTAKIRVLMSEFESRSRNDKVNKRNLRLLLHQRQKLLKYFERKDKGGSRWQNLLQTLGLTPATWQGEINVK